MYKLTPAIARDHFLRKGRAVKTSIDRINSCDVVCEYQLGLIQGYRFIVKEIMGKKPLALSLPLLKNRLLEASTLFRESNWEYHRGIVAAYVEALRYIEDDKTYKRVSIEEE